LFIETQLGSGGGPPFNSQGNMVGIVVATPDAAKLYAMTGILLQKQLGKLIDRSAVGGKSFEAIRPPEN
jgi:hypothetical protein